MPDQRGQGGGAGSSAGAPAVPQAAAEARAGLGDSRARNLGGLCALEAWPRHGASAARLLVHVFLRGSIHSSSHTCGQHPTSSAVIIGGSRA